MVSNIFKAAIVMRLRLLPAAAIGSVLLSLSSAPVSAANILSKEYIYTTVSLPNGQGNLEGINDQGTLIGNGGPNGLSGFGLPYTAR